MGHRHPPVSVAGVLGAERGPGVEGASPSSTEILSTRSGALPRSKRLPRRGRCGARSCRCHWPRWARAGAGLGASALLSGRGARGCSTSGGDVGAPALCVCRDFLGEALGCFCLHQGPAWPRGCGGNSPIPTPGWKTPTLSRPSPTREEWAADGAREVCSRVMFSESSRGIHGASSGCAALAGRSPPASRAHPAPLPAAPAL